MTTCFRNSICQQFGALGTLLVLLFATASCARGEPWVLNKDINYVSGPRTKAHLLDIAVPTTGKGPYPLVVWIHGGAWYTGDKVDCPAGMLLQDGFAIASINYRLSQEDTFPAQIHDCKAAVRYLRANAGRYNIDPKRIGLWGASAGGHLVALMGTTGGVKELEGSLGSNEVSSDVQAVCDWYGPADLSTLSTQAGPQWGLDLKSPRAPQYRLIGGQQPERLLQASPSRYIDKNDPPFLIMHGNMDDIVPLAQSKEFGKALKEAGVQATLMIFDQQGHGFDKPECFDAVKEFFERNLAAKK